MKIRLSFVSNSSSSSFVIVIPNNFDVDKITNEEIDRSYWESKKYILDDGSINYDRIKKGLGCAIVQGGLYNEDNYELYEFAIDLLRKYSIICFNTGPDCGEIAFVKQSDLERSLKEFNEESG